MWIEVIVAGLPATFASILLAPTRIVMSQPLGIALGVLFLALLVANPLMISRQAE